MPSFTKRIQLRRGTYAEWRDENPVLLEGEVAIELDTDRNRIKIGDGTTAWNEPECVAMIRTNSAPV